MGFVLRQAISQLGTYINGTVDRVACPVDNGLVGDQASRAMNGANVAINLVVVVLLGEFLMNFGGFLDIFSVSNLSFSTNLDLYSHAIFYDYTSFSTLFTKYISENHK